MKNKVAPPFRQAEFDILYGQGVSREGDVLDLAADMGLIEKSGAWYTCGEDRIGQGRENARQYLKENPKLLQRLEKAILEKHGIVRHVKAGTEAVSAEKAPTAAKGKERRSSFQLLRSQKAAFRIWRRPF